MVKLTLFFNFLWDDCDNIAWRNVQVVDMLPDVFSLVHFIMRNPNTNSTRYDIRLRALLTDRRPFPDTFLDHGDIFFDLGPTLHQRWVQAGGEGGGFQIVSNQSGGLVFKVLTATGTYIRGIPFNGVEEANVSLSFQSPLAQVRTFTVDATQLVNSNTPLGGMTYELHTKPNPDTDGDGIPDAWEIKYGLDPNNPNDAAQDLDGDGLSNLQEYIAGTDPTDPQSYLRIDQVSQTDGGSAVQLRFFAVSNKTYTVQYKGMLQSGQWSSLTSISQGPTSQEVTVTDTAVSAGVPKRFYRLVAPRVPDF